jgi:hypothetical protein
LQLATLDGHDVALTLPFLPRQLQVPYWLSRSRFGHFNTGDHQHSVQVGRVVNMQRMLPGDMPGQSVCLQDPGC